MPLSFTKISSEKEDCSSLLPTDAKKPLPNSSDANTLKNISLKNDINGNAVPCEDSCISQQPKDNVSNPDKAIHGEQSVSGDQLPVSLAETGPRKLTSQGSKVTRKINRRRRKNCNWTNQKAARRLARTNNPPNNVVLKPLKLQNAKSELDRNTSNEEKCENDKNSSKNGDSKLSLSEGKVDETGLVSKAAFATGEVQVPGTSPDQTTISDNLSSADTTLKSIVLKKQKKLLYHYEIMQKCLNKKILHKALQDENKHFKCPMCNYRSTRPYAQYLMIHLKCHSDLTPIFELYQNFGGSFEGNPKSLSGTQALMGLELTKSAPRRQKRITPVDDSDGNKELKATTPSKRMKPEGSSLINVGIGPLSSELVGISPAPNKISPTASSSVAKTKPVKVRKRKKILSLVDQVKTPILSISETNGDVPANGSTGRGRPFISHIQELDPELVSMLRREIKKKVTEQNPHRCKFCGRVFHRGTGIYAHYFNKHTKYSKTSHVSLGKDGSPTGPFPKFRRRSSVKKTIENEFKALQELEENLNALLQMIIGDTDVLKKLGWPNRNVNDLIGDILERCGLQPTCQRTQNLTRLECLQRNVRELFKFCIKESAMEQYGWNEKVIDDVVRDLIAADGF